MLLVAAISFAGEMTEMKTVDVFHKQRPPALKTLEQVKPLLDKYQSEYNIVYHPIESDSTQRFIEKFDLPETHFPFAVVIDGKMAAKIDDRDVLFFEFPVFMHGIGRHEGNWSLADLETVLMDNSLLTDSITIPEHDHEQHEECEGNDG